ncbi:endoribonuclease/protein kinase IRE1-like protein [Actinidia rufa]|uniref:non-specific serine/threonine protein kinase n=1 Tax=Actinidia rufa TaxID=165716 RepID=A0A7J0EMP5_9ERIC|nr:endoribonuclease/protein kinase IRE1-like protein [Actinidia rufa]
MSDSPHASESNGENIALNVTTFERGQTCSLDLKPDEVPLYITRTDYTLNSFALNTEKVLWNMTVSEIGAAFLCQAIENSYAGALSDSGYELPSKPGFHFNMPLPCQSKSVVYRFRSNNMLGPFYKPNMLPEAHQDMMLPVSDSNPMLRWQPNIGKSTALHQKRDTLSLPFSNLFLSSQPDGNSFLDSHHNNDIDLFPYLVQMTENSEISGTEDMKTRHNGRLNMVSTGSSALSIVSFVTLLVGFVTYRCSLVAGRAFDLNKQSSDSNARIMPSRRKKIRKSGKNGGHLEKRYKNTSSGDGNDDRPCLKLNQSMDDSTGGHTIGKLFVSNREIAKGSNGTIVLEGIYEGRPAAVKRLVRAHHDVAFKEIQNLIASDRHPNIVWWYGVEYDQEFVYLSLERCTCSLSNLIQMYFDTSEKTTFSEDQSKEVTIEYKVCLDSMKGTMQEVKLWIENGYPSPLLLKLTRLVSNFDDAIRLYLNLSPSHAEYAAIVFISDWHFFLSDKIGYGSSGWQAPEQLLHGHQTRAVDMFSLGCILFYCITGRRHPFETVDLFSRLLDPNPELRPKASEVFNHPLVWNSETRLLFFRDVSDTLELEDGESDSDLLKALESVAPRALCSKWDEKMEPAFINNIGRYRRYKYDSVCDLLRVMRNKLNHHRELPVEIQDQYLKDSIAIFANRFPKLLIEVYKVMHKYCREEDSFKRYFKGDIV